MQLSSLTCTLLLAAGWWLLVVAAGGCWWLLMKVVPMHVLSVGLVLPHTTAHHAFMTPLHIQSTWLLLLLTVLLLPVHHASSTRLLTT